MPDYLQSSYWIALIWPILTATIVVAILAGAGAVYLSKSEEWGRIVASVIGFALLGMVTGFLTGLSGDSVVLQAVLPAVLSLVGGIAAFLVSKQPEIADVVAPSIGALAFTVLLGSLWGSNERDARDWERLTDEQQAAYENKLKEAKRHSLDYLKKQAAMEALLRKTRNDYNIPAEPPVPPWPPIED